MLDDYPQLKNKDIFAALDGQREEEEYNYSLQLKRKKETDAYNEQRDKLEKELIEKRTSAEKELN
jgi:hypothetical protein